MNSIQIGMIEMNSGEDVRLNVDDLLSRYKELVHQQVDLVVTPENSLFMRASRQVPMTSFELSDSYLSEIQKTVEQTQIPLILGSIPLLQKQSQKLVNAMVLLTPGKAPEVIYKKIHLFDVDVEGQPAVRESAVFDPGHEVKVIEIRGFKIGLSICYDLRFSDLYLEYAKRSVDVILIPSAFLVPTGEAHWDVLIRARAIEFQCYVIAPAQGGRIKSLIQTEVEAFRETYGHSLAVDPWGKVLVQLDSGARTGVVQVQHANIEKVRSQIPMSKHRRP